MRKLKFAVLTMVFALLASHDGFLSAPPRSPYSVTPGGPAYPSDQAMLRGEFDRLRQSIDISNASSIYTAYQLGRPLLRAAFVVGDQHLKIDIVAHAAGLVQGLPTYGAVANASKEDLLAEFADSLSPRIRELRVAVTGSGPKFDGIPLPYDERLYPRRIFPLKADGQIQINTGNIQQFGYYLSTLLRLAATDADIAEDGAAVRNLRAISKYLANDYLRFFWLEAPAWHWSGPFAGGMKERALARLDGGDKMAARSFFRGFLDYEMHLMAVAADLAAAGRVHPNLIASPGERAIVEDINRVTWRVIAERADGGAEGENFSFDRGYWDDNPVAQYGGCQDARLPRSPCPIKGYTIDISHAQRWPAWLESFAAAASSEVERKHFLFLRRALAKSVAGDIRYREGRLLLTNFLDGRDGWFLTTESKGGHNAHPPLSMTGWAMRYGGYAELSDLDPRIATAHQRFCHVIVSENPQDISFRMQNYGEPEANPANGVRPESDEYGAGSPYAHICRMIELARLQ